MIKEISTENIDKAYYSIREVSEMLDLPFSTLRYWEKEFDGIKPYTNAHQTRFYTAADIELLKKIKYLRQEQHMSIPAVKKHLNAIGDEDARYRIIQDLKLIRQELAELRAMM